MLRETAEKTVAGIIRGLVGPAWKAVAASIVTLRPKLEEGIKSQIGPVIDAQQSITGQARDKTMDKLQPALGEHVYPHVSKIGADILVKPVSEAPSSFLLFLCFFCMCGGGGGSSSPSATRK